METAVGGRDLDILVAGKFLGDNGLEEKDQARGEWQVVRAAEMDGRRRRGAVILRALIQQRDLRPGRIDGDGNGEFASVAERDMGGDLCAGVETGGGTAGAHGELIEILHALEPIGRPGDALEGCPGHFVQAGAFHGRGAVAGAERELVKRSGFSIGVEGESVRLENAVLVNMEGNGPGLGVFHRHRDDHHVGLGGFPGEGVAGEVDGVDAEGAVALEMELVFAANDEGGLVIGGDIPFIGSGGEEMVARALPVVEAPFTVDDGCEGAGRQIGQGIFQDQAAPGRIGDEGQVEGAAGSVDTESQVVGKAGGEDHGCALSVKDEAWFLRAYRLRRVEWVQRGEPGWPNRGQSDDNHGFGIAERRGNVEANIEGVLGGQGEGGDVLEVGGVERRKYLGGVDDGADIGAVHAAAGRGWSS